MLFDSATTSSAEHMGSSDKTTIGDYSTLLSSSTLAHTVIQSGDNGSQALILSAGGLYQSEIRNIQGWDTLDTRNDARSISLQALGGNVGIGRTTPGYVLDVSGNTGIGGTLTVSDATTLGGTLTVTDATTLATTLDVTGNSILHSSLDVSGNTVLYSSLDVGSDTCLGTTLDVGGNTTLGGTLYVESATTLHSNLTVDQATTLTTLNVSKAATFSGSSTSSLVLSLIHI